jgi:hypothetical protein
MEEPNNKQPQFAGPSKTPKRVVRTYQEDLAKMSKDMNIPIEPNLPNAPAKQPEEKITPPTQETPTAPQQKNTVELKEEAMGAETKKHYIEEIETTDSIDLTNTKSFTKKDLDQIINTPPKDRLVPVQKAPTPLPPKDSVIITEHSSEPKKDLIGNIMTWLLGGGGEKQTSKPVAKANNRPAVPAKKLEGISVIPNVLPRVEEKPEVTEVEEVTPPAPKVEEPVEAPAPKLTPHIHHEVVLQQPETPKAPSSSLFAPPKEKVSEMPKVTLPQAPREEIENPSPLSTYTSDARKSITKRKDTPLSVLAQQQDSRKSQPKRKATKSSTPLIVVAVVLLVLGISAIIGAFYFLNQNTAPVETPTRVVTPVFAENRTRVSATGTPSISNLEELLASVETPAAKTLTHITFATQSETGSELIPFSDILLNSKTVPGTLARSVYPQSMFGVYGEQKEPVLVLAVTSFERSFKSLLSWEAEMPTALNPLFGELETTPFATSTPAYIQKFIDEEIETTDARILYDANGETYLIYGYITPNVLFVTQTKETFIDLVKRIVRE